MGNLSALLPLLLFMGAMVAVGFWGGDRREKLSLTDRIARKVRGQ